VNNYAGAGVNALITMHNDCPVILYVYGAHDPDSLNDFGEIIDLSYGALAKPILVNITDDEVPAQNIMTDATDLDVQEDAASPVPFQVWLDNCGRLDATLTVNGGTVAKINSLNLVSGGQASLSNSMADTTHFTFYVYAPDDGNLTNEVESITISYPGLPNKTIILHIWDDEAQNILVTAPDGKTITEEDPDGGLLITVGLTHPETGTVTLTCPGNPSIRFSLQSNKTGLASSLVLNFNSSNTPQNVYLYQINDGNMANETGISIILTPGGGITATATTNSGYSTIDNDSAYKLLYPGNPSWKPMSDGLLLGIGDTAGVTLTLQLAARPSSNVIITATIAGPAETNTVDGMAPGNGTFPSAGAFSTSIKTFTLTNSSGDWNGKTNTITVRPLALAGLGTLTLHNVTFPTTTDLVVPIEVRQGYTVDGAVTLTGSLTDATQIKATLYIDNATGADTVYRTQMLTAGGAFSFTGIPTSATLNYYLMFTTAANYTLSPNRDPLITEAPNNFQVNGGNVTRNVPIATAGKKSGGGGGGCGA